MDFVITDGELNSDGPSGSDTLFIATELAISSQPRELSPEFYVRYESPPSGSNYVKVFLLSDRMDLNDEPEGNVYKWVNLDPMMELIYTIPPPTSP